jgi:putative copper export protein
MTDEGTLHEWLLVLHILASMVWVGGLVTVTVQSIQVLRDREPESLKRFISSLRVFGPRVFAPATVLVLGLGIWMVAESPEIAFGQGWVLLGLGLFGAALIIGAVFQSRAAIRAERAVRSGDLDRAERELRRWSWGMRAILILLVIATWDMVFQPGA